MSELSNPHDHFFRKSFGQPEVAADFLRNYLPAPVLAVLDLDRMALQADSFIDARLKEHQTDLLYQVGLHNGEAAWVYVLFEHKSYPDRWIALQLLRYMLRIWEKMVEADASADLLPILPLVLYHGQSKWNVAQTFGGLFKGAEELRPYWPEFNYQLYDLSQWSDAEIRGTLLLQAELSLLKHIYDPRLLEHLPRILRLYRELMRQQSGLEYLYVALRYLSQAARQVEQTALQGAVEQVFVAEGEESMATIFEQWIEQGMEIGRKQGKAEGKAEGIVAGVHATLLNLLQHRFGALSARDKTALARLTPEQMQTVAIQALEAATLAEIMAFVAGLNKQSRKQSS
jgi:predicted transposase/invertase (TIGR01784 family)